MVCLRFLVVFCSFALLKVVCLCCVLLRHSRSLGCVSGMFLLCVLSMCFLLLPILAISLSCWFPVAMWCIPSCIDSLIEFGRICRIFGKSICFSACYILRSRYMNLFSFYFPSFSGFLLSRLIAPLLVVVLVVFSLWRCLRYALRFPNHFAPWRFRYIRRFGALSLVFLPPCSRVFCIFFCLRLIRWRSFFLRMGMLGVGNRKWSFCSLAVMPS